MSWLDLARLQSPLTYWTVGSVLGYVLATHVAHVVMWLYRKRLPPSGTPGGSRLRILYGTLLQVARFAYYVGGPYLVLGGWPRRPFQGLISLQDLGLAGLDDRWPVTRWLEAAGTGLGLGCVAFAILTLAWMNANQETAHLRLRFPARPWWALLADTLYLEVHWAFYRGALIVQLGDEYAGIFAGLALVYIEWMFNPFWRRAWRQSTAAAGQWLRASLALVIAILFLLTRNLWVCFGIHLLLELVCWRLGRDRVPGSTLENAASSNP